jgi:hypothetical protein
MTLRHARAALPTLARQGALALAWAALAACAGVGGLDALGRLGYSTPAHAWHGLRAELLGERAPAESEALALLDDVADATGLEALRWASVGVADELDGPGSPLAQFNPVGWRVEISPRTAKAPLAKRREVLLHEIGHAVAFASGAAPRDATGSPQADLIVKESLLARQIFHESFADAFAASWALRENRADAQAWASLGAAVAKPRAFASAAHQTSQTLRALRLDLDAVLSIPAERLPERLSWIASIGAARSIAQLGAEREAACSMGARGAARFALDFGYDTVRLPWEMAKTEPIDPTDPMAQGLFALASLRSNAPPQDPWLAALARAKPAIERALARGQSPESASDLALKGMALAHRDALPEELEKAAFAAGLAARGRSGWRGALAHGAMELAEGALPTPTYGCAGQAALRSLRRRP